LTRYILHSNGTREGNCASNGGNREQNGGLFRTHPVREYLRYQWVSESLAASQPPPRRRCILRKKFARRLGTNNILRLAQSRTILRVFQYRFSCVTARGFISATWRERNIYAILKLSQRMRVTASPGIIYGKSTVSGAPTHN